MVAERVSRCRPDYNWWARAATCSYLSPAPGRIDQVTVAQTDCWLPISTPVTTIITHVFSKYFHRVNTVKYQQSSFTYIDSIILCLKNINQHFNQNKHFTESIQVVGLCCSNILLRSSFTEWQTVFHTTENDIQLGLRRKDVSGPHRRRYNHSLRLSP